MAASRTGLGAEHSVSFREKVNLNFMVFCDIDLQRIMTFSSRRVRVSSTFSVFGAVSRTNWYSRHACRNEFNARVRTHISGFTWVYIGFYA